MKTFQELYDLDITDKVKKNKDGLDYLNWLDCFMLLRSLDMNPVYGVSKIKEMKVSGQIIVTVWVKIGEDRHSITYTDARSRDFEFIKQRAFVKCVAINWGLGLKLWEKSEADPAGDDTWMNDRITLLFGNLVPKFGDANGVHDKLGTTDKMLSKVLKSGTTEEKKVILAKLEAL